MLDNRDLDIRRLPLGNPIFSLLRIEDSVYVDKTDLIYSIAMNSTPMFISRPRRFGKSLLINTLQSLFSKGLEDFRGLAIEKLWHDKTYQVIHIDFSELGSKSPQEFIRIFDLMLIRDFGVNGLISELDSKGDYLPPSFLFEKIISDLPDRSIVLLIDEYDSPLTHHLNNYDELDDISKILCDFYAVVKRYSGKFRFVFITGVISASHMSIFSSFNNFIDLTLLPQYNNLFGFTHDELVKFFDPYVQNAANALAISKDDVYDEIKSHYDGFTFSPESTETVYNPWDILNFLYHPSHGFKNYWFQSASVSPLNNYLKANKSFDYINYEWRKSPVGNVELSRHYDIKNIPTKILLYQSGYLTLRARDDGKGAVLVPPNHEIEYSTLWFYLVTNNIAPDSEIALKIAKISDDIDSRNLPAIVELFNDILAHTVRPNSKMFYDERSVRDIIFATLTLDDSLIKFKEQQTSPGFSDLQLITDSTHMVIEFKRTYPKDPKYPHKHQRSAKASLKEAIRQIKTHQYGKRPFQTRSPYYVAMVISTEEKRILPEYCQEVLD